MGTRQQVTLGDRRAGRCHDRTCHPIPSIFKATSGEGWGSFPAHPCCPPWAVSSPRDQLPLLQLPPTFQLLFACSFSLQLVFLSGLQDSASERLNGRGNTGGSWER